MDLSCGKIKAKVGGGSGGHNGVKSVTEFIGNEYLKIRIGFGRGEENVSDYVLSNISNEKFAIIDKKFDKIIKNLDLIYEKKIDLFNSKINNLQ